MEKYLFCICLLLIVSGCEKVNLFDPQEYSYEVKDDDSSLRSNSSVYSLFQNIDYSEQAAMITGEIYCPSEAEYTFKLGFDGSAGSTYRVSCGNQLFKPTNGGSFRIVKSILKQGRNVISISLAFSGPDQRADVRFVIDKINGRALTDEEGFVDLTLSAISKITDIGGSTGSHWVCPNCNALNSASIGECVGCGTNR